MTTAVWSAKLPFGGGTTTCGHQKNSPPMAGYFNVFGFGQKHDQGMCQNCGSWHWQCQSSFKICKFGLGSPFASTVMGIVIQFLQENGINDNRLGQLVHVPPISGPSSCPWWHSSFIHERDVAQEILVFIGQVRALATFLENPLYKDRFKSTCLCGLLFSRLCSQLDRGRRRPVDHNYMSIAITVGLFKHILRCRFDAKAMFPSAEKKSDSYLDENVLV